MPTMISTFGTRLPETESKPLWSDWRAPLENCKTPPPMQMAPKPNKEFPDVELVDLAYKIGLGNDLALGAALTALIAFNNTQDLQQLKLARWWLDYRILKEGIAHGNDQG